MHGPQGKIAGAPLLPSFDLDVAATRDRDPATTRPEVLNVFNPELSATYELDFWGKNRALRDAARVAALASRYDQEPVALTVISSVAMTYFQALELSDRIQVAQTVLTPSGARRPVYRSRRWMAYRIMLR